VNPVEGCRPGFFVGVSHANWPSPFGRSGREEPAWDSHQRPQRVAEAGLAAQIVLLIADGLGTAAIMRRPGNDQGRCRASFDLGDAGRYYNLRAWPPGQVAISTGAAFA
jgi:hypothetical protein